ncbi:MAG: hypothetical protein KDK24_01565 [Pseudooceanicola sp.]|nr:hypothetical protein [Pseudooceanicola sp.]
MQCDWILDVLADLKSFAKANGLVALAEQLDDTTLVAAAEIASRAGMARQANGELGQSGPDPRAVGAGHRA